MISVIPTDLWYTPPHILDCVNQFFYKGWFDPCPVDPKYDGRESKWSGDVFINPPYSTKLKKEFVTRGLNQYRDGDRFLWLVNFANSKDCKVLSENATATCHPYKRIDFIPGHPSLKAGSPRYDSVFYLWGDTEDFAESFISIGNVFIDPIEMLL